jgi:hypothetical protein
MIPILSAYVAKADDNVVQPPGILSKIVVNFVTFSGPPGVETLVPFIHNQQQQQIQQISTIPAAIRIVEKLRVAPMATDIYY